MGVRKLFPSLYKKYKNKQIVFASSTKSIDVQEFYIDTNCLLHPKCFEIFYANKSLLTTNLVKLEHLMILNCIEYLEMIIGLINPTEKIFIAIDGVAPLGKLKQQHSRRYKTIFDARILKKFCKKHNEEYQKSWNNSAITPGTEFMEKITNAVIQYLEIKQSLNADNSNKVQYIFSSAYTSDEGEHKILQEIKRNRTTEKTRVIYGLDADLLYLSLAAEVNNLYLFREVTEFQHFETDDKFCYVSIDLLGDGIFEDIQTEINNSDTDISIFSNLVLYKNQIIRDYIQFGFNLGNDFLSHLPSVNLKFNKEYLGLNVLIKAYVETFQNVNENKISNYMFLIDNTLKYNYEFCKEFFGYLASSEETFFIETRKFKRKYHKHEATTLEEEINIWDNLQFYIPDLFQLGNSKVSFQESKRNFYEYYKMSDTDNVIREYFKGLSWNGKYYMDKCPDYLWYYPYDKSPFVTDIYEWLLSHEDEFKTIANYYPVMSTHESSNKHTIFPLEQLTIVLPPQSSFLLPKSYKSVVLANREIFPHNFDVDMQDIVKMFQAHPKVKLPEVFEIKHLLLGKKLTKEEQKRNRYRNEYNFLI